MKKVREIMRLYEQGGLSQRQIAQALGISRPVVSDYIIKIKTSGLVYKDIENMPDETLIEILQRNKETDDKRYKILQDKFPYFAKELKRIGDRKSVV